MPSKEVPDPIDLGSEKGIIKHVENVDAIGCSFDIDKTPHECIVTTTQDGEDIVVEPDFVQVDGLTQFPPSIASYSDPSYEYNDPPNDVVTLTNDMDQNSCYVVRIDEDATDDGQDIGLACYPDGYSLETVDAGMTDEIYEDARELGIGNY